MMANTVELIGLKELQLQLLELPKRVAQKALTNAVRAEATVIKKEAIRLAPTYHGDVAEGHPPPGTLKKSIIARRWRKGSNAFRVVFIVNGIGNKMVGSGSNRRRANLAYYWHMVERGTAKMMARPFLRPAFESKKEEALRIFKDRLGLEITKAWGKK